MAFGESAILRSKHTVRSVHRVAKHSTNHKYFGRQREIPSFFHSYTIIYLSKNATIIYVITFCLFVSLSLEIFFFQTVKNNSLNCVTSLQDSNLITKCPKR